MAGFQVTLYGRIWVTAEVEIVRLHDAKMFAYIWNALVADYKDEMRKIERKGELLVDWDQCSSWRLMANTEEQNSSLDLASGKQERQCDYDSMA